MKNKIKAIFKSEELLESLLDELEIKSYKDEPSVEDWNPNDNWQTGEVISSINNYYIKLKKDGNTLDFGIFDNKDLNKCLGSLSIELTSDYFDVLKIRKVPIVFDMRILKEYRGKGLAKILYKKVIDRFGILLSDTTVFEPIYHLWLTYIKSIPGVELYLVNYVDIKPFDDKLATEDVNTRIVAVLKSSYKSIIKNQILNDV